ncbi:MAG: hypothetical protein J0H36_10650 [Hyphomicrobium denitrificans]|nr:hypothetical protein [Hyphomicrobium denitrificans]
MTGLGAIFRIFGAAIAFTLALAGASHARGLNDAEKASLSATVSDFNGAIKSANIDRISQTVPLQLLKSAMDEAPLEAFSMDVKNAAFKETPQGEPYALIPTEVALAIDGKRFKVSTHTLALIDGETWYLVRVSEQQQIALLREAYPNFVAEEFPESRTEALN